MRKPISKRTFTIISLGCPKNTVDSEILRGGLTAAGWRYEEAAEKARVIIINTCGFIRPAKTESIEVIFEALRLKQHGLIDKVIVIGCLTQRYPEELGRELPAVDQFFGVDAQADVIRYLTGRKTVSICYERGRNLMTPHHLAYLKIAEGCDNVCAFCAIPLIRGRQRSRPMDSLLREAEFLAESGVRELVVIAQDTTRYGSDLGNGADLANLMDRLLGMRLFPWVRLMYANPEFWHPRLTELFAYPELCRYLDLPIQHAADRILQAMQRTSRREMLEQLITNLRREVPGIALRTAVMTGFPGETEEDFKHLMTFIEAMRFERLGAFYYSEEEGTAAVALKPKVRGNVAGRRKDQLLEVQWAITREFAEQQIGKLLPVMIDRAETDHYVGRTSWDAPEVDCEVTITSSKSLQCGLIYPALITAVDDINWIGTTDIESHQQEKHYEPFKSLS